MLSSVDWADLSGDREKWQAVDNTEMNCRGAVNSGDLFDYLRSYSLLNKRLRAILLISLLVCMFVCCVRHKR